tara:strand:- start:301 stop:891 length:591 start_codon:yes stop_codon:yes gene_type:complete
MNFILDNINNKNYIIVYIFIVLISFYLYKNLQIDINNIFIICIIITVIFYYNNSLNQTIEKEKKEKKNISDKLNIDYDNDYEEFYNILNDLYKKYYKYNKYAFNKSLLFAEKFIIGLKKYNNQNENIENLQFLRQNFLNNLSNIVINIPLEKEDYFNEKIELLNEITLKYLIEFSGQNSDYISNIDYFKNNSHFIY